MVCLLLRLCVRRRTLTTRQLEFITGGPGGVNVAVSQTKNFLFKMFYSASETNAACPRLMPPSFGGTVLFVQISIPLSVAQRAISASSNSF